MLSVVSRKGIMKLLVLHMTIICILICSCISGSDDSNQLSDSLRTESGLVVVDSFGVEIGDSLNMIASIDGCFTSSDGSIVLLDATARKVRVIPVNGEPYCFGQNGQGPEDLLNPKNMCLMSDDRILISDDRKFVLMQFDISGSFLGNYLESGWKVPEHCLPIDSNSVVGAVFDVEFNGEETPDLNYYVGRFDSSAEASIRYIEVRYDLTDPRMYTQMDIVDYCVDPNGQVYILPDHTNYRIDVMTSDGEEQGCINPEVLRLEKTDEEMANELSEFKDSHVWDSAYTGGYEPLPYRQLIDLVGVDSEGNLWVQRMDKENMFFFDLWDSSGNYLDSVISEQFISNPDLEFHVDANGILGIISNSSVHSRVYRLEII